MNCVIGITLWLLAGIALGGAMAYSILQRWNPILWGAPLTVFLVFTMVATVLFCQKMGWVPQ